MQITLCVCVCLCLCLCLCYVDFLYDFPVSTQSYKVVKGTSQSSTTEMRTVMRTTDIPVTKGSKLTWRKMWEIDVVSIMKEDFIENDKHRSKYGWLPKMATCSKESIGSLLASSSCERINSSANQVLTLGNNLLGDGWMEKVVMCRMNRDFMVFMRESYPQVADEQFEFGILKVEDNRRRRTNRELIKIFNLIYLHCDLPVSPPRTHHIHHDIHDTFVKLPEREFVKSPTLLRLITRF